VLRIFIALKSPSPSAGIEPANLRSNGKHYVNRHIITVSYQNSGSQNLLQRRRGELLTGMYHNQGPDDGAVRTSATSVHFTVTTRRYIPDDSKLHTRRRENMKSHNLTFVNTVVPGGLYQSCRAYVLCQQAGENPKQLNHIPTLAARNMGFYDPI
jgi:hypothetical protein